MHASDQARLHRLARGHVVTQSYAGTCESGSLEEAEALALIDQARADEEAALAQTPEQRRRRARKHWSGRAAQLGRTW